MWEGGTCFIIGGGPSFPRQFGVPQETIARVVSGELPPSAYSSFMAALHDKHIIGVNNAYQIGTWIDCVFFGDHAWYLVHRKALSQWPNLKITCSRNDNHSKEYEREGVKVLSRQGGRGIKGLPSKLFGISTDPRRVAWNHNSGAAAISLAVHFGVARIILLGFDMSMMAGFSHWHKGHGRTKPPPFERHLRGFSAIAEDAHKLGIEILNASPESAIAVFPKVTLAEVLQ